MTDFAIPKRVSVEDLKDILKAYYIEGAHSEPVRTDSVENTAGMGDKVGRQTNFLIDVGLIIKQGRKRALTEDGESIAEALMGGNESLAKSLTRETLNEWKFTDKIKGFVRMQEPEPVEQARLMEYISANANSTDNRGRRTLIEFLVWADILDKEESGYTLSERHSDGVGKETESDTDSDGELSADSGEKIRNIVGGTTSSKSASEAISINVEISATDEPADIESAILAARRALTKDIDETEE